MKIDPQLIAAAQCDGDGVPLAGRRGELAALRRAGYVDLSVGRIYEGHVNALQLVGRFGTAAQRETAHDDVAHGRLFGVWNTQDDEPVRIVADGARFGLVGAKSWASGAAFVTRPIVTAAWPDGSLQMCLVPMDAVAPAIDASAWQPHGMHDSQSYLVAFDGITLDAEGLVGGPGDYVRQPWFFGGAIRFTAVQNWRNRTARLRDGALSRRARPRRRSRAEHAAGRNARRAAHGAALARCRGRLWSAYDAAARDPNAHTDAARERAAEDVVETADGARIAIERAALEVIERAMRAVGARGLLEPLPFVRLVRDLEMYLRQPAPDAVIARVGRFAFAAASAQRSAASADDSGSGATRANASDAQASKR